jgi:hypothetical protein
MTLGTPLREAWVKREFLHGLLKFCTHHAWMVATVRAWQNPIMDEHPSTAQKAPREKAMSAVKAALAHLGST